jgi:hypothetical protein
MSNDVLLGIRQKYSLPILSVSDKFRIRYTSIRICIREYPYLYSNPKLSVFKFESERKYENKYGFSDIRPYSIRLHPYPDLTGGSLELIRGTRHVLLGAPDPFEQGVRCPLEVWTHRCTTGCIIFPCHVVPLVLPMWWGREPLFV